MAVIVVNGISVIEKPGQEGTIQFKGPTAKRVYGLTGSFSKLAIQIAVITVAPQTESSISSAGLNLTLFLDKFSVREIGGGTWEATCDYCDTPQQFDLKFNIGVQTTKMQQCKEHIATYDCVLGGVQIKADVGDGDTPFTSGIPDFQGAVGVNSDQTEVAGVNVEIAKIDMTITLKLNTNNPIGFNGQPLSPLYFWSVANITPSVNNADYTIIFKGQVFVFPKGSLKFSGAPMTTNSDTNIEITFMFSYSRNVGTPGTPGAGATKWAATETYGSGAQVTYNGYLFTSTMVGNLDNPPNGNTWSTNSTYQAGDMVYWNGSIYAARVQTTGNQPDVSATQWTLFSSAEWAPNGIVPPPLVVGNSSPIVKEGWWYLWFWYKTGVNNGSAYLQPTAAVVDRMYDYADFTILGIPSTTN